MPGVNCPACCDGTANLASVYLIEEVDIVQIPHHFASRIGQNPADRHIFKLGFPGVG